MELKVEKVALLVGVSVKTINSWYWFKAQNPENEYAKMLPEFERRTALGTRYWKSEDIQKLVEFKTKVPHGRNGILGDVTQKYARKQRKKGE
jgi:hypothetical protein